MIFRVNKTANYTVMSNYHFKERDMSLKAKGLLSMMLSLPDDWDYSIEGLSKLSSDGESAVRSALQELEQFGYLVRNRIYKNGRISDWEYNVYEQPVERQDVENQQLEKQALENMSQLNTKESSTKEKDKIKELKNKGPKTTSSSGFLKHSKQSEFKIDGLIDLYITTCTRLPKVRAMTDSRKLNAEKIYKKYGLDAIKEVFEIANNSPFLTGDNDRSWKASFDFIMKEEKFVAILEGKYNNHSKREKKFADEGLATCLTRKAPRKEIDKNVKRKTY